MTTLDPVRSELAGIHVNLSALSTQLPRGSFSGD